MGLLDKADDMMHEKKGEMKGKSDGMGDKAKAKMEEMRRKNAESKMDSDSNDSMAA
jgi:hypothetical protein